MAELAREEMEALQQQIEEQVGMACFAESMALKPCILGAAWRFGAAADCGAGGHRLFREWMVWPGCTAPAGVGFGRRPHAMSACGIYAGRHGMATQHGAHSKRVC